MIKDICLNFTNEDEKVKVNNVYSENRTWFLTEDGLYEVLMLKKIDEDENLMNTIYASGQRRQMWFLTEDGLYEVLMLKKIDEDEKVKQITPIYNVYNGQYENQECLFLTEDGLYEVLMQSRKPIAKAFKKALAINSSSLSSSDIGIYPRWSNLWQNFIKHPFFKLFCLW